MNSLSNQQTDRIYNEHADRLDRMSAQAALVDDLRSRLSAGKVAGLKRKEALFLADLVQGFRPQLDRALDEQKLLTARILQDRECAPTPVFVPAQLPPPKKKGRGLGLRVRKLSREEQIMEAKRYALEHDAWADNEMRSSGLTDFDGV